MFRIELAPPADTQIRKLPASIRLRLEESLRRLAREPDRGKRLKGPLAGLCSERVGDYRIIYKLYPKERRLVVLRAAHRREVYR